MLISGAQDIHGLRAIGQIVAQTLRSLEACVVPGITTGELDAICARHLEAHGASPAPMAAYDFPGQLCISVNDDIVHGVPGARVIRPGDLVKLDLEAEKDGYIADATIAVAVPPVSPLTQRLATCAQAAFYAALPAARAGCRIRDIGRSVEQVVTHHGFSVVRLFCGHGVGRFVHEKPNIPNYDDPDANARLSEGMVITIEPIITAIPCEIHRLDDGWTVRTAGGVLAAHFEHTLIITGGEPVIVTTL